MIDPLKIVEQGTIHVHPSGYYIGKVVKSGHGAVVNSYKRHIGKKVIVILIDGMIE